MKVLLDTSVIVAGLVRAHARHADALAWLTPRPRTQCCIAAHALAETWATLTAMPIDPRITGDQARRLLEGAIARCEVLASSRDDYALAIARCIERGVRSGAVYDALHVIAAERARADAIVTATVGDFERLVARPGPAVRAP